MQYPAASTQFSRLSLGWLLGTVYWFSEYRIVVKPDVAARSLLGRIDDAGIEGLRIHVQTHRALVSFPRIDHPVHRLFGIDGARIGRRQFHRVRCLQLALACLDILKSNLKISTNSFPIGAAIQQFWSR